MIKALRRKFTAVTISLLAIVFAVLLTVLNLFIRQAEKSKLFEEMRALAEADKMPRFMLRTEEESREAEQFPESPVPPAPDLPLAGLPDELPLPTPSGDTETEPFEQNGSRNRKNIRTWRDEMAVRELYLIRFGKSGKIISRTNTYDFGLTEDDIAALAAEAVRDNGETGTVGNYLYLRENKRYGYLIVLRNYADVLSSARQLLFYSVLIGLAALLFLFLLTILLSRIVTKPAEQAFTRQKQFIADASHELKTPLSAISVNADVLSGEIGPNKWLMNITSECSRMEELVLSLLTLARMDAEEKNPASAEPVNLSETVLQPALSFESAAYEKGIDYSLDIDEDVMVSGHPGELKQLAAALIDNAVKYADEQGSVAVSLKKADRKACLTVSNTGRCIGEKDLPHLFERFYRADESRSDGNSFGLGLAIAAEIVRRHNGTITAESKNGRTVFTVTL